MALRSRLRWGAARLPATTLQLLLALSLPGARSAGFEDLFGQAFGGGGGKGQTFHFQTGGGGGQRVFQMGGGQQRNKKKKQSQWPAGTPDEISREMEWLKGTEWSWNDRANVRFRKDGTFEAPGMCQGNDCRWAASRGKVYIMWDENGMFDLEVQGALPDVSERVDPDKLRGMVMEGFRRRDRGPCEAKFRRVYDLEAAGLNKDLYQILGLSDDADDAEIKKVYRKLSIKYHPDKNPDEESKKMFNEVRDAYEILNDPEKKILYDTGGMEAVLNADKGEVQRGEDATQTLSVGLEDLYNSGVTKANHKRIVVCRGCRLRPDSPKCKGCIRCPNEIRMGKREVMPGMFMPHQEEVESKEKCKADHSTLDVHVERGMRDGETVTFPRMTDERPGMIPGSLVFNLKTRKHAKFERRGNDLHMDMKVSLQEALLGWQQTIRHLDGHLVDIGTSSVTRPFQVLKVQGEGMPLRDDPASFGDLYIKVEVAFPTSLTEGQRELANSALASAPPREEL